MSDMVVITLRPVSSYDFQEVKVDVLLHKGDFTRAVRDAVRRVSKTYPKHAVSRFDVVSIYVI